MRYLLIESRDVFESADAPRFQTLAAGLAKAGHAVTLFLVQNGVLSARRGPAAAALTALSRAKVEVLADDFSLRERGIAKDALGDGVRPVPIDAVIDALADGARALWH